MAILVTGGAGYIGSHTVVELQQAGRDVVVLDNLCNSSEKSLQRVEKITGKPVRFYKADIRDRQALEEIFSSRPCSVTCSLARERGPSRTSMAIACGQAPDSTRKTGR